MYKFKNIYDYATGRSSKGRHVTAQFYSILMLHELSLLLLSGKAPTSMSAFLFVTLVTILLMVSDSQMLVGILSLI